MNAAEPTGGGGQGAPETTAPTGTTRPDLGGLSGLGGLGDLSGLGAFGGLEPLGDAGAGVCADGVCAVPGVEPTAPAPATAE